MIINLCSVGLKWICEVHTNVVHYQERMSSYSLCSCPRFGHSLIHDDRSSATVPLEYPLSLYLNPAI